jgi:hypothetical protein
MFREVMLRRSARSLHCPPLTRLESGVRLKSLNRVLLNQLELFLQVSIAYTWLGKCDLRRVEKPSVHASKFQFCLKFWEYKYHSLPP